MNKRMSGNNASTGNVTVTLGLGRGGNQCLFKQMYNRIRFGPAEYAQ